MTNFQAALGLSQLKRFDEWLIKIRQLYKKYNTLLGNCRFLTLPENIPGHSWQTYMVVLDKSIARNQLIKKLKENDIETNLGAHALHIQPYYTKKYGTSLNFNTLKTAELLYTNGLALPFHHGLTEKDIQFVCNCLLNEIGVEL
jgi:dTDP-4-amino-4,6-dideoxygalactose transaminase